MTTLPQIRLGGRLKRPSWPVLAAIVLALAVAGMLALRGTWLGAPDPLAGGRLAPVTRGDLLATISATGTVEPRRQAELSFGSASGRVSSVLVDEGDMVAEGAELMSLDTRRLSAEVAAAQAIVHSCSPRFP